MNPDDLHIRKDAATVAEVVYQLTKTRDFFVETFNEAATPAEKSLMSEFTRTVDLGQLRLRTAKTREKRDATELEMLNALIQRAELLNTAIFRQEKFLERNLPRLMASLREEHPHLGNPAIVQSLEDAGAPLLARNFKKGLTL